MKMAYFAGAALALAALIPLSALSQDATGGEKKKGPPANAVSGVVKSVDASANTVTVEVKGGEAKTFTVNDKTKIKIDKADKTLADLTEGLRVMVVPSKKGDAAMMINGSTAAPKGKGGGKKKGGTQ
jgi:hypothetical protein